MTYPRDSKQTDVYACALKHNLMLPSSKSHFLNVIIFFNTKHSAWNSVGA